MNDHPDDSPLHHLPPDEITLRFQAYAIELMGEALIKLSQLIRHPEKPSGSLINTLEHITAALRQEPYKVYTEYERQLHLRSTELLNTAYDSVNGPDTIEARAKLYRLVEELRKQ